MELIHLGMNDPTSIYGNFTFYLVKYGEPEFDTILKFVGEVPDKHDYLTADGYYEEHSVNEIVFLFEYIYSEDKKVCRNARCTFFLVYHYTNRFIFFKLR